MRVKIAALGIYTYPGVTIVCGESQLEDGECDTLLNPTVIVEILSPSTQEYDRSLKLQRYHLIPSFQEYLLITQDRCRIEHAMRQADNSWSLTTYTRLDDVIALPTASCVVSVVDTYRKVTFDQ